MPVTPTYPGVYVEEIPSGVRTITGVATSITAFLGRAGRAPTDRPVTINSFGDFERTFGGLWSQSALGYAVRDFYLNGGSQAVIVRLFHPDFFPETQAEASVEARAAAQAIAKAASDDVIKNPKATPSEVATAADQAVTNLKNPKPWELVAAQAVASAAEGAVKGATTGNDVVMAAQGAVDAAASAAAPITKAAIKDGNLTLEAASEGTWGNGLRARVDYDTKDPKDTNLFNLFVRDGQTQQIEVFRNVSIDPKAPRRVDKVLANESDLVRWLGALPGAPPAKSSNTTDPGQTVWQDNHPPTNSKVRSEDDAVDGDNLEGTDLTGPGKAGSNRGLFLLQRTDLFNLLCIPPFQPIEGDIDYNIVDDVVAFCQARRAFFLIDPPSGWHDKDAAINNIGSQVGSPTNYAALFFPRLLEADPLRDNQIEAFVPSGAVAGVFARTDGQRGVWKAPAGLDATLLGVPDLAVNLSDAENGELNPLGINCLRIKVPAGRVVWGARTREGDDKLTSDWKYIPVRRLALFIEESLFRGTQWVVFEPNDEPLWAQIRLNVGAFMQNLFRQGAFQGSSPREAYFVKCDKETTTQNDIDLGIVNIVVGFAPLKPAEFVIIQIQQIAGAIAT